MQSIISVILPTIGLRRTFFVTGARIMERPITGRRHLSTISFHLQKTTKTASVSALIFWPSLIMTEQQFIRLGQSNITLCGPCGSSLLVRPH